MFFVTKAVAMGKTKKDINNLLRNDKIEKVEDNDMKKILGGREKMSKLRRIILSFTDIMPL